MSTDEWSLYLKKRHEVKEIPGVSGVGLAGPEVIAYVEKITPELLREIPEQLAGIPIVLKEVGRFRILPLVTIQALSRTDLVRPVPGGVSVGHFLGETGTHGTAVNYKGGIAGLSNNHVAGLQWGSMMEGQIGDVVLQPGLADYSGPGNELGNVLHIVPVPPVESGMISSVDAAVYSGEFEPEILGIGLPASEVRLEPGMLVAKSGRTTGLTTAYIETVGAIVDVEGFGIARFENVAITDRAFSMGGDSGSLVVENWARSGGAVFAGSEYATVICEAIEIESQIPDLQFGFSEPHLLNLNYRTRSFAPLTTWVSVLVGGVMCMMVGRRT